MSKSNNKLTISNLIQENFFPLNLKSKSPIKKENHLPANTKKEDPATTLNKGPKRLTKLFENKRTKKTESAIFSPKNSLSASNLQSPKGTKYPSSFVRVTIRLKK